MKVYLIACLSADGQHHGWVSEDWVEGERVSLQLWRRKLFGTEKQALRWLDANMDSLQAIGWAEFEIEELPVSTGGK